MGAAIFDLDAGRVTITLPDAGKLMSLAGDQRGPYTLPTVIYGAGSHTILTKEKVGTRYVVVAYARWSIRTIPQDIKQVHALQDAHQGRAAGGPGKFEVPELGPGKPEEGARRVARVGPDPSRFPAYVWHERAGRSGPAVDRGGGFVGRQSRGGSDLSQRHAAQKRRQDGITR